MSPVLMTWYYLSQAAKRWTIKEKDGGNHETFWQHPVALVEAMLEMTRITGRMTSAADAIDHCAKIITHSTIPRPVGIRNLVDSKTVVLTMMIRKESLVRHRHYIPKPSLLPPF